MEHLTTGAPPITVQLRRNGRARGFTLRVSSVDSRATLTCPSAAPIREAQRFLDSRADWLAEARARAPQPIRVEEGTVLPVEGRMHRLVLGDPSTPGVLALPGPRARLPAQARAHLTLLARQRLSDAVARYAARIGRTPARLTLRDPRSRWGSCTGRGNLMFSWRLIMAPPEVLDYVAAHEVAHLSEMNHGPRFWALLERLSPDHGAERRWLREEGAALHRYRFGD
ncbi:MAG: SprT family zinc-dependent metalloprotease [Pseudomonadota bacterium]